MRTFNGIKKILNILLICMMVYLGDKALGVLLEPISYATHFNHDVEQIEAEQASADLLFVGASRVYRSFVPEVFKEKCGLDLVVNAGSSSQRLSGSYYQLKDLMPRIHPRHVVLGVTGDNLYEPYYTQANLVVADRLHGINKFQYIFDVFEPKDYGYAFSKAYRFRNNLDLSVIQKNRAEKQALQDSGYSVAPAEPEYYADHGFVYSYATYAPGTIPLKESFVRKEALNQTELIYLDKIVDLCKSEGVSLSLVVGPTTMMRIYNTDDYDYFHQWFVRYAEENGLAYHNLNYLKGRETFLPDSLMHDYNHVNGEGAKLISEIYADILNKTAKGIPTDDYFYESFSDLMADVNRIVAVNAEAEKDDANLSIAISSLHNPDVDPYYQVVLSYGDSGQIISDWSHRSTLHTPVPGKEPFTVTVRAKIDPLNDEEPAASQVYTIN